METVVRSYDSIEALQVIRPAWERLQRHPNADMDFYLTVLKVRPSILRPHIITLEQAGRIAAMLIGRIEQAEINCRLGYKDLLNARVRALTIVHGGVLGDAAGPHAELLLEALLAGLRQGEADVVMLSTLDVESDLFRLARRRPGVLCRDLVPSVTPHRVIELPSNLDALLRRFNAKRRKNLRRIERHVESSFQDQVGYRLVESLEEVPALCEDLEAVARLTYQRGLGAGFFNDEEHRQFLALEASRGHLCALVLYLSGRPCAFQLGTIYQGTFHLDHTGYDPALRQYEVGTLVLMKMIDHLCQNGIQRFDFGLGDADYKRELATTGWQEATIHLFAPRLRPMAINAVRELIAAGARGMQHTLTRLGLERRIKQLWRRRLAHTTSEA